MVRRYLAGLRAQQHGKEIHPATRVNRRKQHQYHLCHLTNQIHHFKRLSHHPEDLLIQRGRLTHNINFISQFICRQVCANPLLQDPGQVIVLTAAAGVAHIPSSPTPNSVSFCWLPRITYDVREKQLSFADGDSLPRLKQYCRYCATHVDKPDRPAHHNINYVTLRLPLPAHIAPVVPRVIFSAHGWSLLLEK